VDGYIKKEYTVVCFLPGNILFLLRYGGRLILRYLLVFIGNILCGILILAERYTRTSILFF